MSALSASTTCSKLTLCGLFASLIAVGAFIKIPVPFVPFTLQFLFTTLAGLLLGPRLGSLAVAVYIAIGLLGLPVFAGGGGPGYLLQPTFGYLLGFYAGAYVTAMIAAASRPLSLIRLLLANLAGLLLVYLIGMLYYYVITSVYLQQPLESWPFILYCLLLPLPGDLVLCLAGALLARRLLPILSRSRLP